MDTSGIMSHTTTSGYIYNLRTDVSGMDTKVRSDISGHIGNVSGLIRTDVSGYYVTKEKLENDYLTGTTSGQVLATPATGTNYKADFRKLSVNELDALPTYTSLNYTNLKTAFPALTTEGNRIEFKIAGPAALPAGVPSWLKLETTWNAQAYFTVEAYAYTTTSIRLIFTYYYNENNSGQYVCYVSSTNLDPDGRWRPLGKCTTDGWTAPIDASGLQSFINQLPNFLNGTITINVSPGTISTGTIIIPPYETRSAYRLVINGTVGEQLAGSIEVQQADGYGLTIQNCSIAQIVNRGTVQLTNVTFLNTGNTTAVAAQYLRTETWMNNCVCSGNIINNGKVYIYGTASNYNLNALTNDGMVIINGNVPVTCQFGVAPVSNGILKDNRVTKLFGSTNLRTQYEKTVGSAGSVIGTNLYYKVATYTAPLSETAQDYQWVFMLNKGNSADWAGIYRVTFRHATNSATAWNDDSWISKLAGYGNDLYGSLFISSEVDPNDATKLKQYLWLKIANAAYQAFNFHTLSVGWWNFSNTASYGPEARLEFETNTYGNYGVAAPTGTLANRQDTLPGMLGAKSHMSRLALASGIPIQVDASKLQTFFNNCSMFFNNSFVITITPGTTSTAALEIPSMISGRTTITITGTGGEQWAGTVYNNAHAHIIFNTGKIGKYNGYVNTKAAMNANFVVEYAGADADDGAILLTAGATLYLNGAVTIRRLAGQTTASRPLIRVQENSTLMTTGTINLDNQSDPAVASIIQARTGGQIYLSSKPTILGGPVNHSWGQGGFFSIAYAPGPGVTDSTSNSLDTFVRHSGIYPTSVTLEIGQLNQYIAHLPRYLDRNINITVNTGVTPDTINISGFYGPGTLTLTGGASSAATTHQVGRIIVTGCKNKWVYLSGFYITQSSGDLVQCQADSYVYCRFLNLKGGGTTGNGIVAIDTATVFTDDCRFGGLAVAMGTQRGRIHSGNNILVGDAVNVIGFDVNMGGIITKHADYLTSFATTINRKATGGVIFSSTGMPE
jgi:hypothetical protein